MRREPNRRISLRYLLPGGRRFIYLVRSAQQDHRGLFLGSLDDPTLKQRVLPDDSNAVFAHGHGE